MEVDTMRKLLTALVAAASIGAAAIATSSSAEAWRGGWGWGWGPGAVVGGVIAGAVVGSAIASRPYYYPYGYYGYGPNPYYDLFAASEQVMLAHCSASTRHCAATLAAEFREHQFLLDKTNDLRAEGAICI